MTLKDFISKLNTAQETVTFSDTMALIETHYAFTPTAFTNGQTENAADQNNGSCKILAFGQLNQLTETQTLHCFGDYYRQDVLQHPNGSDHQNIRQFMLSGWPKVTFSGPALQAK